MKRAFGLLVSAIVLMLASAIAYNPAALAAVAGIFSTISVASGGSLNGTFGGNAVFSNIVGASITGNAATSTRINSNGAANQVWGMNGAGTAQGWQNVAAPAVQTATAVGCTTGTGTGMSCQQTLAWSGGGFADANYQATCSAGAPFTSGSTSESDAVDLVGWANKAPTTIDTVTVSKGDGQPASVGTVNCIGFHN